MARNASRYLFLFLIGLVVGIVGTVMSMRAIEARQDHFPGSVMEVQAWHMGQLLTELIEDGQEFSTTGDFNDDVCAIIMERER